MKSLIVPVITPAWIPSEDRLPDVFSNNTILYHGAEETTWTVEAIDGVPQVFHDSCERLLSTFSNRASGVLVWGTTGEGIGFWPLQYHVLLNAMKKVCPQDLEIYAGVLLGDSMVWDQVRTAQDLGIKNIVLWLNHTRNPEARFDSAITALSSSSRLFLYNLPTFRSADRQYILSCLKNPQVAWFKDSSGDTEFFIWLLSIKKNWPDFQVFHGSEWAYGELFPDDFAQVDGLVAWTANVNPPLLAWYTNNPHDITDDIAQQRMLLNFRIKELSWRGQDIQKNPTVAIERYIHGLKMRLMELEILSWDQVSLYSAPSSSLFRTHQ